MKPSARPFLDHEFRPWVVTVVLGVMILLPCLYGFGTKFSELLMLAGGDSDGAFALSPIINYLLASLGFFFLFCWAMLHGMFRDIERPKFVMLETEERLDEADERLRPREPWEEDFDDARS